MLRRATFRIEIRNKELIMKNKEVNTAEKREMKNEKI